MKNKEAKSGSVFKGLTFNIVVTVTVIIMIFGMIVEGFGYLLFTDALTGEYNDSALRTAETALMLVNADNIPKYLDSENAEGIKKYYLSENGERDFDEFAEEKGLSAERKAELKALAEEYALSLTRLNILREKQNVTLLYAIAVDTRDYEHFYSVFNCVTESAGYSPWELGKLCYTTKTEDNSYQRIYKGIYFEGLTSDKVVRTKNLKGRAPHITSLIPIKNGAGEVVAIMCVQRPMEALTNGRVRYALFVAAVVVGMAAIAILAFTVLIRRQVVRPLKKVGDEAERFAHENSAPSKPLGGNVSKVNEISALAVSIDEMEKKTLDYIENLSKIIAENQRIGVELGIASIIQESSIPTDFPAFPDRREFDLYATMRTAKEVGGDFYDFFMIDDDHLALVIADVSGKGVPASLFMMVNNILINERALMGGTPAEILEFVNDRICENNKAEMFVTVWLGILEISSGVITAVNAGHDAPAIVRADGSIELVKAKRGVVIGAMTGVKYADYTINLAVGDKIFTYTDGVPEATDANEKMFTVERMLAVLNKTKDLSPKDTIESVVKAVDEFVGDAPQFDDMTLLCLSYFGKQDNAVDNADEKVMEFIAHDDNLHKAMAFLTDYLKEKGCAKRTINQLSVAFEEIFVNVAHYAYRPDVGNVEIALKTEKNSVFVKFTDCGKPYNPLERADPDVGLSADERAVGGLGIFMTKKLVDDINYKFVDGKNVLILEKKF